MFCFPFFVLYAMIKLANLIWLPENNGIFLNYSQCPHLPIFKLWEGEAVFKTFSRLWVLGFSLQSTEWWVPTTLPTPLIYHILNFHLAPHRVGCCLRRPLRATTWKAEQLVPIGGDLRIHWALHLSIPHCSTKKL